MTAGARVGLAAVLGLLAGGVLGATPVAAVDATTTCLLGVSQEFCTLTGHLTSRSGAALPSSLTDIVSVKAVLGELDRPAFDRSPEMADQFSEEGFAPLVAGAQMICSIQLSLDAVNDLAGRQEEAVLDTRRRSIAAHRGAALSSLQIELTLGTALASLMDAEKTVTLKPLDKRNYTNFALVNQFHINTRPVIKDEPQEDEEDSGEPDASSAP